ncbi:MAG: hypothetical protein A2544_00825 [Candidatus Zambryskibacteria bacterium RIFOXYD2_FULL_43_10]|uniref:Ada DNA repair metal-binding domain-containing protein n=1 Tax=Candidatus Zambryskibacteria bacterium RIFOXYD2_FULL_43_10 TaxID=1802782 RepID=A0A1G2V7W2_9BACT|nr:MAG: hypothetical protein A2544_00825 [Candidatus Zambryskibacteria bacterium RIFOXYD2_FULL_43_10]
MSLQDIWEKIKPQSQVEVVALNENGEIESFPLFRKLFLSITIILVVSLSFGIGRLSVVGKREPIRIEYDPEISKNQVASVIQTVSSSNVIVSKNGVRYHYLHCAGAKQIKEENKIVFASPASAEAAGYTLAANCSPKP